MKTKIGLLICLLSLALLSHAQLAPLADNTQKFPKGQFPPGYVDPDDTAWQNTCFSYMGAVEFTSAFRFYEPTNGAAATKPRSQGFSIPLVADLNGDGYPEVITNRTYGDGSIYGLNQGILIYNGQDGQLISNLMFPGLISTAYLYNTGYHTSPSIMALVDSDRNGTVEAIVAFPSRPSGTGAAQYTSALASFNIVYDASSKTYSWNKRWQADNYNSGASNVFYYGKTIPQIVDIDGDGVAEVLVQNKIYNAQTGALLITLEALGTTAYTGADLYATNGSADDSGDTRIPLSYTYDIDLDGNYEVIAGGKIYYNLNLAAGTYNILQMSGVIDGRTGVADVDGDGIPDVVVVNRGDRQGNSRPSKLSIVVWNPNFWILDTDGTTIIKNPASTPTPSMIAELTFDMNTNGTAQGNNSYVYIGDIDGREQTVTVNGKERKYRLPEIAVLGGRIIPNNLSSIKHPNISSFSFPNTTTWTPTAAVAGGGSGQGVIAAFTIDVAETNVNNKLKTSFVLEHSDRSINTGFTMFDFDNDGMQEICYRDEYTLRIIKAGIDPYVPLTYTEANKPEIILFRQPAQSFTGFEYPVIADIDNDSSAEMVVIGRSTGGTDLAFGFPFAVGSNGDKFSPALPVWNQFMYDPFKINPDLTTPWAGAGNKYKAPNRLEMKYEFSRLVKSESGVVQKVVEDYTPYNGTLIQMPKYMLQSQEHNGTTYDDVFEPIIFLTHAYIVDEKATDVNKRPKVNITTKNLEIYIGNGTNAETDIALSTPITVYENSILPIGGRKTYQKTLLELGVTSAIKSGEAEERLVKFPVDDAFNYYIIRIGDATDFSTPTAPVWKFGVNDLVDMDIPANIFDDGIGVAKRAYRDCDWTDQTAKASAFMVYDDASTTQEYTSVAIDVLENDMLPDDFNISNKGFTIINEPAAGSLSITGKIITYTHNAKALLDDCIDKFTYQIEYTDIATQKPVKRQGDVYIYVLQAKSEGFAVCKGATYNLQLKIKPEGTVFHWYADATTSTPIQDPTLATIPNVQNDLHYFVVPDVSSTTGAYKSITFPRSELIVKVVGDVNNDHRVLQWTGEVNNEWTNASNWKEVQTGGTLVAVAFAPTVCVDVIVPMVTTNYPELSVKSDAARVTIGDRAMIKNTFLLNYTQASTELKLLEEDYDRWISYSGMFDQMFSGDFIMALPKPIPAATTSRATYMALYEKKTPINDFNNIPNITADASVAKQFTEPFEAANVAMKLESPFMFYVDESYVSSDPNQGYADVSLVLPGTTPKYGQMPNYPQGTTVPTPIEYTVAKNTSRIGRFNYENYSSNAATGEFSVTMDSYSAYVLISNPYPAYLSVNKFLEANAIFVADEYMIWTGKKDDTFVTKDDAKARFWKVSDSAAMTKIIGADPDVLIPPFQSFFVKRKNTTGNSVTIKYLPQSMSVTKVEVGGYKLR